MTIFDSPAFRGWVAGYGVQRLAGDLGVDRTAIHSWISGRRTVRMEFAIKIEEISGSQVRVIDVLEPRIRRLRAHQR